MLKAVRFDDAIEIYFASQLTSPATLKKSAMSPFFTEFNLKFSSLLLSLLLPILLPGCVIVDPHNMLSRQRSASPLADTPVPSIATDAWKKEALDYVWNTVNEKYYDPKFNGQDWRAVRLKYEPLLQAASNDDEYWELLDKMTGELKDSHTRVHSPKQVEQQRNNEAHSLGLSFAEIDNVLMLTSVHPESDAYWAGARVGMTIKAINGEPGLALYQRLASESRDSSTPWARIRGAVRKINSGDIDTSVNMTFVRDDPHADSEITATMKRRKFKTPASFTKRVLPSGFGYIRFSGFVESLRGDVIDAIDGFKDTPGLIIDLRGNGGGSGGMSQALITKFLSDTQKPGRLVTRTGKPITLFFIKAMELEPELKGDKKSAYTKPLVILTNEGSASASEMTAGMLQDLGRATIIGERSCGCLLAYLGYADVPGGGWLAYSEIGFVSKNGKRVEATGVIPDIAVQLTRKDYLLNRDRVLETAETFLRNKKPADDKLAGVATSAVVSEVASTSTPTAAAK